MGHHHILKGEPRCSQIVSSSFFLYGTQHVGDIYFRQHFGSIRVFFLQNKICPVQVQGICIYVGHSLETKKTINATSPYHELMGEPRCSWLVSSSFFL